MNGEPASCLTWNTLKGTPEWAITIITIVGTRHLLDKTVGAIWMAVFPE